MAVLSKADAARAGVAIDRAAASVMRTAGGLRSYRWGVANRLALHRASEADVEYGPVEVAVADLELNAQSLRHGATLPRSACQHRSVLFERCPLTTNNDNTLLSNMAIPVREVG